MKTAYPAIIHPENGRYWVEFPDLDGCFSDGDTLAEAVSNAEEALIERQQPIPAPSDIQAIQAEDGFTSIVVTEPLNYMKSTRSVKKTLTIPEWLNAAAEKRHINFSSVLQQALVAAIE